MVVTRETPVFFVRPFTLPDDDKADKVMPSRMDPVVEIDSEPPAMLSVAMPIVVVSATLGMAPVWTSLSKVHADDARQAKVEGLYARSEPKRHVLARAFWLEIYSIAVLGCVTASSYMVMKASGDQNLRLNNLANVLIYASGLLTACVSVLVQLATLLTTRSAIDSLEGLFECEEETQTLNPTRFRKAKKWIAIQLLLWLFVSVSFALYHFLFEATGQQVSLFFCFRAYAVSRPFMHMSCMQFANQAHALSLQLTSINNRLLTMLGPVAAGLTPRTLELWCRLGEEANPLRQPPLHPDVEAEALETVHELRLLHHKMHVISGYLQSAYGPQMLLVLLCTLLDYTTMLYILLARLDVDFMGMVIGTVHVVVMYLVLTSGNMVRAEAQRMGEILQRGLVHRRLSDRLVEELQDFSLQLVRLPTRLSACGLMYLDYSMIQGAVGTVTTYLVIMLQFPNSSGKNSTSVNSTLENTTSA